MASDDKRTSRDTPSVFSRDEAMQIREMVRTATKPVRCPRCDEALTIGPAVLHHVRGKQYTVRALTCPRCHRLLSIKDSHEKP